MRNTSSDPQFPLHNMAYTRKSLFNKEMSFVYLLIEDVADLEHGETWERDESGEAPMSDGCVSLLTDALGRPVRISADFLNMPSPTVFRIGTGEISEKGKWLLEEMKSRTPVKVKEIPQRNLLDILLGR